MAQRLPRTIVSYAAQGLPSHERASHTHCAREIAKLTKGTFTEAYDPTRHNSHSYFVPSRTLLTSEAHGLGIHTERDFYGGAVPVPFVATKAITHPLSDENAVAPKGWSKDFEARVRSVVHRGVTVFSLVDARRIAKRLVAEEPIRMKLARANGGAGQTVLSESTDLQLAFEELDAAELQQVGLVFEENLTDVITYSVGCSRIADMKVSYYGTQRLTANNNGEQVYGGSDLFVVRGDLADLLAYDLSPAVRVAVDQARVFDIAVHDHFREMFASRRNYDVAQGRDWQGNWRSGVLEQSWRIGGATPAELIALQAFREDPGLAGVRASSVEEYGTVDPPPPPNALVYFHGVDEQLGKLKKYAVLHDAS